MRPNGLAVHPSAVSVRTRNRGLLDQFVRLTHGNCQVRPAKVAESGEVHADDPAVAMEERSAGTAGGGQYIVNSLVSEEMADVSLSGRWAYEVLRCQLGDKFESRLGHFPPLFVCRGFPRGREYLQFPSDSKSG